MRNHLKRSTWSVLLAMVGVAAIAAAIAANATAKGKARAAATGTINLVEGTAPQSLDPGLDYTTQGSEVNWLVYTGLTTYARKAGAAGGQVIPGLATSLPKITNGGKTYTITLHKGLKYSNGDPVKASDFTFTVERAVSIPWGGASAFITPYIKGAAAYASHKAKTISGITTNDATGKIVIHLTQAYGPFSNVLAFPALGLVDPKGTSVSKAQPSKPPAGVGPYMVTNIQPNASFDVVKNPNWTPLPGIPSGYDNIDVKINSNVNANADAVLNGSADVFDWADTIPGSVLRQIQRTARNRFSMVNLGGSTYYVFLNASKPPFNNLDARIAVIYGLNQPAYSRLGGGTLAPACFFLPPAIPGHPSGPCPYGNPAKGPNLKKARAMLKKSGQANVPVTIYTEQRSPRLQWMEEYQQELKAIGFTKVTLKQVADANYFTTIGEAKSVNPQTGFADWNQDFPNPVDFYGVLLNGKAITPTNNENFGQTNDPYVNKQVAKLGALPITPATTKQWQKLDRYVAQKAYAGVFGYQKFPFFTSSKIVRTPLMINPIYGWDFSELRLK